MRGFSGGAVVNNLPASVGDVRHVAAIPAGMILEAGNGNSFQYSSLKISKGRGHLQAIVHMLQRVRQTEQLSMHACIKRKCHLT